MVNRMSKSNVWHSFVQRLQTADDARVEYNSWNDIDAENVTKMMLNQQDEGEEEVVEAADEERQPSMSNHAMHASLVRARDALNRFCRQLPILGFNSSKYDLNFVKAQLAKHLRLPTQVKGQDPPFVVKKGNQYLLIATPEFRFLDISQYLPPGTSYSAFLKAYKVSESKGFFPYEYLDSEAKLDETSLPPEEAFWSSLKKQNVLEDSNRVRYDALRNERPEDSEGEILKRLGLECMPPSIEDNHRHLHRVWRDNDMSTLRDLLVWYNNLDVAPGVEAAVKMQNFYRQQMNVDLFHDGISVPGIARKLLFRSAVKNGASFSIFDSQNSELYATVKLNIVGGSSIVFKRLATTWSTLIRGDPEQVCRSVMGYDANALYLSCLGKDLPVSHFVRWLPTRDGICDTFKVRKSDTYTISYHWMDWLCRDVSKNDDRIQHKQNAGRERRVEPYMLDGYRPSTSEYYDFQGCYWHGHAVSGTCKSSHKVDKQTEQRYARTLERERYIRGMGYTLVTIWECEFRSCILADATLQAFVAERQHPFTKLYKTTATMQDILTAVNDDTFFGMVEVDVHVPNNLYQKFSEMSPLFATTRVPFSSIGLPMQEFASERGFKTKSRTLLVGGMKAKTVLLATPLLRWYMQHGLFVSRVYQAVEYGKQQCFLDFTQRVTEARRRGDADSDEAIMANIQKLIGNSAYGCLLLDKSKHQRCFYVEGCYKAKLNINDPRFVSASHLDDDLYEVVHAKTRVTLDMPITLGYFVLQYAKQRMLEFYFDFLQVYVSPHNFELLQCDTDSLYLCSTGNSLSDIIRHERRDDFDNMLNSFCDREDMNQVDVTWFV